MHHSPSRRIPGGPILVLIGLLALAGCKEDEITHSIVPRAAEPEKTRLLGVIYPHGDQTWFFKLVGPESAVEAAGPSFLDFVNSARFNEKADPPVTWKLPDGWAQDEAPKPPLYAAFHLGPPEKPLKATVTVLPRKKESEVFDNVNRWRGQLGLEPIVEADLPAATKNMTLNGDPAVFVDLTGGAAKKAVKGPAFTFQKPDGWTEMPDPGAGLVPAEAIFQIDDHDPTAKVTVTAMGGPAGGLMPNVQRWCNQIDAPPVAPEQMDKFPKLSVAGRESPYVDLAGKKGRILGAIVPHGDKTWFFKMSGPADLVEKQKPKFEEFLKSVKFAGAQGGDQ